MQHPLIIRIGGCQVISKIVQLIRPEWLALLLRKVSVTVPFTTVLGIIRIRFFPVSFLSRASRRWHLPLCGCDIPHMRSVGTSQPTDFCRVLSKATFDLNRRAQQSQLPHWASIRACLGTTPAQPQTAGPLTTPVVPRKARLWISIDDLGHVDSLQKQTKTPVSLLTLVHVQMARTNWWWS